MTGQFTIETYTEIERSRAWPNDETVLAALHSDFHFEIIETLRESSVNLAYMFNEAGKTTYETLWPGAIPEMCEFSRRFRDVVFKLICIGEQRFSPLGVRIEVVYFKNGLAHYGTAQIVSPRYDPSLLGTIQ